MDERIIERLKNLDLGDFSIAVIKYMYDNGDITEEDIFDIGEDDEFNIENMDNYELKEEPVEDSDSYGTTVEYNGESYYIFDNYEDAEEAAIQDVKDLLDMEGITILNFDYLGSLENYVDTEWFEDAYREMEETYCWDIASEGDSTFDSRLVAECYDEGILDDSDFEEDEDGEPDYTQCLIDEDELVEKYTDVLMDRITDYVSEYISEFGEDDFNKVVINKNLVDLDELAKDVVSTDGVAHSLSRFDDEEREVDFEGVKYYLYRFD